MPVPTALLRPACLAALLVLAGAAQAQGVQRIVGPDGRVTYSDRVGGSAPAAPAPALEDDLDPRSSFPNLLAVPELDDLEPERAARRRHLGPDEPGADDHDTRRGRLEVGPEPHGVVEGADHVHAVDVVGAGQPARGRLYEAFYARSIRAAAAILGFLTYTDRISLPALFGVAALLGVARAFAMPATTALAPNLVPPEVLPRAIATGALAGRVGAILQRAIIFP